jgi:hypothetical protein
MRHRSHRLAGLGLGLVAALSFPGEAHAYEEQVTVGLVIDYGLLPMAPSGAGMHGLNGGITASYGLGDTFSLEARLEHAYFPDPDAATHLARGTFGMTYAVDVLTLVPLFGAGLGGALGVRDGDAAGDLVLYGSFALDYLVSRQFLVGGEVRAEVLPIRNIAAVDLLAITAGLRIAWIFDTY